MRAAIPRIELRGDAWRWWNAARGVYDRGHRPAAGAVLVLKRQRDSRGHLAVVRRIVNSRLILADHANWLNEGRIYRNTPIVDVSKKGDWSECASGIRPAPPGAPTSTPPTASSTAADRSPARTRRARRGQARQA